VVRNGKRNQNQRPTSFDTIQFNVQEEPKEWLMDYFIGRVSDLSKVRKLHESFILGGFNFIRVRFSRLAFCGK